ncbi:MAG: polymer-forming cytoskeletal protein [Oligoflexia bacterium]|nr:polymer-forming cytoskeletal protein [Oligoflexia bacterium]
MDQTENFLDLRRSAFTFMAADGELKGDFSFSGTVRLAATMEGTLSMREEGKLFIERDGCFKGSINGYDVDILGRMDGEILARGRVILRPSAVVKGKIIAKDLVIYPGALLDIDGETYSGDVEKLV